MADRSRVLRVEPGVDFLEEEMIDFKQAAPQPEPVAFYDFGNHRMRWAKPTTYDQLVSVDVPELPLYTHPPQRQPLTDEEINALALADDGSLTVRDFVRAIEKAHGIGGDK